jgi:hypothetical protein
LLIFVGSMPAGRRVGASLANRVNTPTAALGTASLASAAAESTSPASSAC